MQQSTPLSDKVAFITGAASGLGHAVARKFAAAGTNLFLVDIDGDGLIRTANALEDLGVQTRVLTVDLAFAENCSAAIKAAVDEFGRLDALCNVAAVMLPQHTTDMPPSAFATTLAVNLSAPFYLIQAAIPHLIEANGAVVNVASVAGITAQAYNAAYCASKAGLIQMTKSLAMEYMHTPIRINAVAPGGMMTPLVHNMRNVQDPDPNLMARTSPLRGLVDTEEVAEMVAFLGSDKAQGYHGTCIVIDKGMCAG